MLLIKCCESQNSKKNNLPAELEGVWISIDDDKYRMEVFKNTIKEYYIGENEISLFNYRLTKTPCDSLSYLDKGIGYYLEKTEKNDSAKYCYSVMYISETALELNYQGGRRLSFIKEKR